MKVSRESLDLIFCRNAFHHIASRVSYFRSLRPMLKSNGRAAIIDYKEGCGKKAGHYVRKEKIIKEMQQAGYRLEKEYDFLSEQSFTVYAPVKV
ncbi:MAG: class I SAM-dependent methyltransferase [Elusimicrobiota bacterium]